MILDPDLPSAAWDELSESGRVVRTTPLDFASIPDQVRFLRRMVIDWRGRVWTRETAIGIVRDECPAKQRMCQALALAEWVQGRIYYVNERPETFQTPYRTVELGAGDCDDQTVLLAALLESIGIETDLVTMRVDGSWRHIFPRAHVRLPSGRTVKIPLDTTLSAPVRSLTNPILITMRMGKKVDTFIA